MGITLSVADRRVTALQEAMRVSLQAQTRLNVVKSELAEINEALDQVIEAIYNATLYDPAGERDDEAVM